LIAASMRERIVTAVVDTSPLLSVLILEYMRRSSPVRSEKILSGSRIADYLLHDQKRRMNFAHLFEDIPNILTTSHVLGELQGLQRLKEDYQRELLGMRNAMVERERTGREIGEAARPARRYIVAPGSW
jgi:hypothetical protein